MTRLGLGVEGVQGERICVTPPSHDSGMMAATDQEVRRRSPATLPAVLAGVADESFRRRHRTLMRSRPIAQLDDSAAWGGRMPDADATGLALAAVDLVISRQGLADEVTYDQAHHALVEMSARADPGRPDSDHEALASLVLDGLMNKADGHAKFTYTVGNWSHGDPGYTRTVLEFWLLREKEDRASGELVLHADPDAINALVSGLSFDVTDDQAAAELVLRRQIQRGEFGKAEATAQRSLHLTVQYTEQLRALLTETRRDLRSVARRWDAEIPGHLATARSHLNERLHEEDELLDRLRDVVDDSLGGAPTTFGADADGVDRDAMLAAAARAARLLRECRLRHASLLTDVLGAIDAFLTAQTTQAFRPMGTLAIPNLLDEVLTPMLDASMGNAETVAEAFLRSLSVSPRRLVRLVDLISDMLAAPRPEPAPRIDTEGEADLGEVLPALSAEIVAAATRVIDVVGLPARLSELLAESGRCDSEAGVTGDDIDRARVG